jgi:hypothetical protein
MKIKTTKMVEEEITVVTCDKCGKEIGRGRRDDYDGYGCSLCYRQYCYECFDKIATKIPELCMHVCDTCMKANDGLMERILSLSAQENLIRNEKFGLMKEWKQKSNPNAEDEQ